MGILGKKTTNFQKTQPKLMGYIPTDLVGGCFKHIGFMFPKVPGELVNITEQPQKWFWIRFMEKCGFKKNGSLPTNYG